MGKDKKKKHKKKHKKQDVANTTGWTRITISAMPLPYDTRGWVYLRVPVPQEFQDAFEDGELEP